MSKPQLVRKPTALKFEHGTLADGSMGLMLTFLTNGQPTTRFSYLLDAGTAERMSAQLKSAADDLRGRRMPS